jgi:nicotinate phosphoribosyltransferase
MPGPALSDALFSDLYELTMLQAYWMEGLHGRAVFSLFFRELPAHRRMIVACGQEELVRRRVAEKLKGAEEQVREFIGERAEAA